ncbi:MAG: PQQ-binding-like beta-propeller repeat protein [Armatimonadetes bacterium]|nr:PQQ-binding-like beta-propeller repeat protein [Armatimonadota bacterium]
MRRSATSLVLATVLLASCSLCAADWPVACHDLARTGIAEGAGPAGTEVVWATELGASVDGSPIVVGETVYVGTSAGRFAALSRADGSVLWTRDTGGPITGAACVAGDRVFIGCGNGMVHALRTDTGEPIWSHRTSRPVLGALVALDDAVIIGSIDGTLRSVNASDGRLRWIIEPAGAISAPPAVRDGIVYYGDEAGLVCARRASDGSLVWQAKVAGSIVGAPTLVGERLYVPLMSFSALSPPATEFICAFDAGDGARPWRIQKPQAQSVMGSPAILDTTLWAFVVEGYTSSGILRGLNLETGEQIVETKFGTLVVDGALAVADGNLYFAAQDGRLYICDARTGAVRTRLPLGGPIFSSPAISDGLLYVGCQDGKLYCVR